jgi:hypothetical protein
MSEIKGINFLDVEEKFKIFNSYVAEDVFETHNEDQVNEFITGLMKKGMKDDLILQKIRELISEYKIMKKYTPEDYQQTLQDINELLGMISK